MLTKIQEKRVLNVAKALREAAAAKQKFDMGKWVFGDSGAIIGTGYNYETCSYDQCNEEANICGTPACALGHYAARTDLQRILKVSVLKNSRGSKVASMDRFGAEPGSGADFYDEQLMAHFGLTQSEMLELFDADGCGGARTALQAAKYIEKFVKRKQRSTHEV